MKNLITILSVIALLFSTSCKKNKIENTVQNTTWKLTSIILEGENKTVSILKENTVFTTISFGRKEGNVTFSESTRPIIEETEKGDWTIEKIIPTVGKNYYLIKNTLPYSQNRVEIFNLNAYGSQLQLIENNLIQEVGEYIVTYEKVN